MLISDFPFVPDRVTFSSITEYNFQSEIDEVGNEIRANLTDKTGTELSLILTLDIQGLKQFTRYYRQKKGKLESFSLPEKFWRNLSNTNLLIEIRNLTQTNWIFTNFQITTIVSGIYEVRFSIKSIIEEDKFNLIPDYSLLSLTLKSGSPIFTVIEIEIPIVPIYSTKLTSTTSELEFFTSIFLYSTQVSSITPTLNVT